MVFTTCPITSPPRRATALAALMSVISVVTRWMAAARSLQDQAKGQVQTIAVFTLAGDPAYSAPQPAAQHHAAAHARTAPPVAHASQRLLPAAA